MVSVGHSMDWRIERFADSAAASGAAEIAQREVPVVPLFAPLPAEHCS